MLTLDKLTDLKTGLIGKRFHTFNEIVSTNQTAKLLAVNSQNVGAVIIAESQSGGRGRQGRGWHSPPGLGLWFSAILPGEGLEYQHSLIPLMTSLSIAEAIETLKLNPNVKWPNDVLIGGKKVCGILAEAVYATGRQSTIVLGIGINVNHNLSDFPEELQKESTSLKLQSGQIIDRISFLRQALVCLDDRFAQLVEGREGLIIDAWKLRCPYLGKLIATKQNGVEHSGVFEDIDRTGRMLVLKNDGKLIGISAGEIYVREKYASGC